MDHVATVHERVCALMRDGRPRLASEVADEIGTSYKHAYVHLALLETETSLKVLRAPGTNKNLYVWNDA